MKKIKYVGILLLILTSGIVLLGFAQEKIILNEKSKDQIVSESTKVVIEYWKRATNNDDFDSLITEMPQNFIKNDTQCKDIEKSDDFKQYTKDKISIIPSNSLTSSDISFNKKRIYSFAENIRERKYEILKIVEERENENAALVKIGYGNEQSPWNQENFLLVKSNNDWEIFAIMESWLLEKTNNYYAKKLSCN